MIELVVVVIYWTECMPRKFDNEIRLPGTTGIDNLPIPFYLEYQKILLVTKFKVIQFHMCHI